MNPSPEISFDKVNLSDRSGHLNTNSDLNPALILTADEVARSAELENPIKALCTSAELNRPKKGHDEDRWLNNPAAGLFAVFDGVGSDHKPAQAAEAAQRAIHEYFTSPLQKPLLTAEDAIDDMKDAFTYARMVVGEEGGGNATTAVVAKVQTINNEPYLVWGNAGDSRLFLRSRSTGQVTPVSTEQCDSVRRNVVNNCFDNRSDGSKDEFGAVKLKAGDRIMLCSDGITGDWEEQRITEKDFNKALNLEKPEHVTDTLLKLSSKRDDKTVLVADIGVADHSAQPREKRKPLIDKWAEGLQQKREEREERRTQHKTSEKKPFIDRYADSLREKREAKEARRAEWEPAEEKPHRLSWDRTSRFVRGVIDKFRADPAIKADKAYRQQVRREMVNARDQLIVINARLANEGLDETTEVELQARRAELKEKFNGNRSWLKDNSRRAQSRQAREQVTANREAGSELEFHDNPNINALFKDLHEKRIAALKLGLETGYKLFKGKGAYDKAYTAYRKAFLNCQAALLVEDEFEGGTANNNLIGETMVIKEIAAMESWQFQLMAEAQYSRRGRIAMWYHRQNLLTKGVIGASLGLTTGGLAGIAGGAIAGVGLAASRIGRSQMGRVSQGVAGQSVRGLSVQEKYEYLNQAYKDGTAEYVFESIATGQREHVEKNLHRKRVGVGVSTGALVLGSVAGRLMSDHIHSARGAGRTHTGGSQQPLGPSASAPGASPTPGLPGGLVEVSPAPALTAPSEIVSHITPGAGLIDNLTHTEVGLNPVQAARAVARMRAEGLLDGTHIAGVAERAGRIVVYARGAGDGALHFSDPRVLEIIQETKSS